MQPFGSARFARIPDDNGSVNGGVPRWKVLEMLENAKFVAAAVRDGRCFHCRTDETDATGLCLICRSFLNDDERRAAQVYYDAV